MTLADPFGDPGLPSARAVGGIVLSLVPGVPVSVFVTAISFAIFLVCWALGRRHREPAQG